MVSLKIKHALQIQALLSFLLCAWPCLAAMGPGVGNLRGIQLGSQASSGVHWGAELPGEAHGLRLRYPQSRSLLQMTENGTNYILAAERTSRKDPLRNWKTYIGGWNIRDKHYWASVGSTATAAWVVALLWAFFGVLVFLGLCCCLCCRRRSNHQGSGSAKALLFVPVVVLTILAVIGCGLLYSKTVKWNQDMRSTLDVVVDEASLASMTLRNVSSELESLTSSQFATATLRQTQQDQLKQRVTEINRAASELDSKARDNSKKIKDALGYVRNTIIVVSALMLLLSLLGLLCLLFGLSNLVYTLAIVGWILIVCTWILVGVGLILDNATQDTCVAMQDWLQRPAGGTTMDDILPCADLQVADRALIRSKETVNSIVAYTNNELIKKVNDAAAQSGGRVQPMATACSPYGPDPDYAPVPCPAGQIDLATAYTELGKYVGPALPKDMYDLLGSGVNAVQTLVGLSGPLSNLTSCSNVRNAITRINNNYCSALHSNLKGQWVGLLLISVACSILLILWLIGAAHRRRDRYEAPHGAIMKPTPYQQTPYHAPPPAAPAVAQAAPTLPRGVPSAPRSPRKEVPPPPVRSPKKYVGDVPAYDQLPQQQRPPQPAPSAPKIPGYYVHNV